MKNGSYNGSNIYLYLSINDTVSELSFPYKACISNQVILI